MYESSQETRVTEDGSQALFLRKQPLGNRVQGLIGPRHVGVLSHHIGGRGLRRLGLFT